MSRNTSRNKPAIYRMTRSYLMDFFYNSVKENRLGAVAAWTQRSLLGERPILPEQQQAFFVAERIVLTEFLVRGKIEEFRKLMEAFNVLYQHHHYFKMKEFDTLFFAVMNAEDYVVKNLECRRIINNIIHSTFSDMRTNQELKDKFKELDRLLSVGEESNREVIEHHTNSDDDFVER